MVGVGLDGSAQVEEVVNSDVSEGIDSRGNGAPQRRRAAPRRGGRWRSSCPVMSCWEGKFGFLQAVFFGVHWELSVLGTTIEGRKLKGNLGG